MSGTRRPGAHLEQVARAEKALFGGVTEVLEYRDSRYGRAIHLLQFADSPRSGLTSFGTIGLSNYDDGTSVDGKPLRVELLGVSPSNIAEFPNMLSTCAFLVESGRTTLAPGSVVPDVIAEYRPDLPTKHFVFVAPTLWPRRIDVMDFESHVVSWLLAIPITDSELAFSKTVASEALQERLMKSTSRVTDFHRKSVA